MNVIGCGVIYNDNEHHILPYHIPPYQVISNINGPVMTPPKRTLFHFVSVVLGYVFYDGLAPVESLIGTFSLRAQTP